MIPIFSYGNMLLFASHMSCESVTFCSYYSLQTYLFVPFLVRTVSYLASTVFASQIPASLCLKMNASHHFKVEQDATKLRNVALFSPPVSLATTTALRLLELKKKGLSSDTPFLLQFQKMPLPSKRVRGVVVIFDNYKKSKGTCPLLQ